VSSNTRGGAGWFFSVPLLDTPPYPPPTFGTVSQPFFFTPFFRSRGLRSLRHPQTRPRRFDCSSLPPRRPTRTAVVVRASFRAPVFWLSFVPQLTSCFFLTFFQEFAYFFFLLPFFFTSPPGFGPKPTCSLAFFSTPTVHPPIFRLTSSCPKLF